MKSPGCCAGRISAPAQGHSSRRGAGIFAGLRLALIYAWLGNIGAEYFMSSGVGIGSLMINAQQLLDMPTILCGMVLVGITGAALDKAGRLLEMRATRWRQQEQL
jgi:sulfonate transport system permease protein